MSPEKTLVVEKRQRWRDLRGQRTPQGITGPRVEKVVTTTHLVEPKSEEGRLFFVWRGPQESFEIEVPESSLKRVKKQWEAESEAARLKDPKYGYSLKEAVNGPGEAQEKQLRWEAASPEEDELTRTKAPAMKQMEANTDYLIGVYSEQHPLTAAWPYKEAGEEEIQEPGSQGVASGKREEDEGPYPKKDEIGKVVSGSPFGQTHKRRHPSSRERKGSEHPAYAKAGAVPPETRVVKAGEKIAQEPGIPPEQPTGFVRGPSVQHRERRTEETVTRPNEVIGSVTETHQHPAERVQKTEVTKTTRSGWKRYRGRGALILGAAILAGAGLIYLANKEGYFDVDTDGDRDSSVGILIDRDSIREALKTELVPIGTRLDRIEQRLGELEQRPPAAAPLAPSPAVPPRIAATTTGQLNEVQAKTLLDWFDGDIDGRATAHLDRSQGSFGYDTVDWALARNIEKKIGIELIDPNNPAIAGDTRWHEITLPTIQASGRSVDEFRAIPNGTSIDFALSDRAARYIIAQNKPLSDEARIALASPANFRVETAKDVESAISAISAISAKSAVSEVSQVLEADGQGNLEQEVTAIESSDSIARGEELAIMFAFENGRQRFERASETYDTQRPPAISLELLKGDSGKSGSDDEEQDTFLSDNVVEFMVRKRAA